MPRHPEDMFSPAVMSYMRNASLPETTVMGLSVAQQYSLPPERAEQFAALLADVVAATQRDSLSITEVKKNPGKMLADLFREGPQRFADAKKKELPEAMVLATRDVAFLINTIVDQMTPNYATGKDLFAQLARDGRPYALTLEPPREEPYQSPRLEQVLGEGHRVDADSGGAEKAA